MYLLRIITNLAALICLLTSVSCDSPTNPDYSFPDPIDGVATGITLTICHGGPTDTLAVDGLSSEGEYTVQTQQPDDRTLIVYATADGFYTEFYTCTTGAVIDVDLDAVPQVPNALTGMISYVTYPVVGPGDVMYLSGEPVEVTGPFGLTTSTTTDEQGRFGLGNLPTGSYTIETMCGSISQSFEADNTTGTDYVDLSFISEVVVLAPNLYLYPEEQTDVSVVLDIPSGGHVTESEPSYGTGWNVAVSPDGLIDNECRYLFYEAVVAMPISWDAGWVLDGGNLESDIRALLTDLGFVGQEIDDFVDYWLPRLGDSPWYVFYPQDPEQMSLLNISPAPDNVLRALFYIRPTDHQLTVPLPPQAEPFVRDGFSAAEWGVIGWHQ